MPSPRAPWALSLPRPSLKAPRRASALSEWALLPLRLFLGVTFLYAGLQKLANPNFFNKQAGISIYMQLSGAARFSPIHTLLHGMLPYAGAIGLITAYAELAIGLGTLLGFMSRIAAAGGAVLSFFLFLAISFHTSPYFTGADIVFFFAWLPLVVAGSGSQLSLDGYLRRVVRQRAHVPPSDLVALPFAQVQRLCGNYQKGSCSALAGAVCDAGRCPVLLGRQAPIATPVAMAGIQRRQVVVGGATAAAVGVGAIILGSTTAALGKLIGNAPSPSAGPSMGGGTTTTTTASTAGSLGLASQVPLGSAATFTIPTTGDPGIIFHTDKGWFGYDTVCPHAGCTVNWNQGSTMMICPCHGSSFQVANGDVINGPASHGLTALTIVERDGHLFLG